jgi:hypothetical protein
MAIDFSLLSRIQLKDAIRRYAFSDNPFNVRPIAINAVNDFNELLLAPLDEAGFDSAVQTMAGKLDVAQPAIPADLETLTDDQLRALAQSLELAEWDYHRRNACLAENHRFWKTRKLTANVVPTASQYLAMLLRMMNYVRAKRGLAPVT